jgi:hypothetical protein
VSFEREGQERKDCHEERERESERMTEEGYWVGEKSGDVFLTDCSIYRMIQFEAR